MQKLVDEIKQVYTELGFTSRWTMIQMYHEIGRLLASQVTEPNISSVSNLSGISERSLQRSVQFYKKYPSLELLPAGKNISWHQIVNKYLPETKPATLATPATLEKEEGGLDVTCPMCHHTFTVTSESN